MTSAHHNIPLFPYRDPRFNILCTYLRHVPITFPDCLVIGTHQHHHWQHCYLNICVNYLATSIRPFTDILPPSPALTRLQHQPHGEALGLAH